MAVGFNLFLEVNAHGQALARGPFLIEIDYEVCPSDIMTEVLETKLEDVTGRDIQIWIDDQIDIQFDVSLPLPQLEVYAYRDVYLIAPWDYLYIVCVDQTPENPDNPQYSVGGLYDVRTEDVIIFYLSITEFLHEIGHSFGLGHCDNTSCVMAWLDQGSITFCDQCTQKMRGL
jgi:hypothetical protein